MYIPDNSDVYETSEREQERFIRIDRRIQADETEVDTELPWVIVPQDNGNYPELYFKEETAVNIIKVKFLREGQPSGRAYTYYSDKPVAVEDKVQINLQSIGIVTEIDVPKEEVEDYKNLIKFIHGKYEEPVIEDNKAESICDGCGYSDIETGMCASHEGCIRAGDRRDDLL